MTNEEAKKAGFRSASGALYVYWYIYNGLIFASSCYVSVLTANYFPTRAKAREALRKRKADAEHAKWLADMQAQATPITKEQAKMLREGDSWYYYNPVIKSISECVKLTAINADQSFGRYFTRAAAQAALDEAKAEAEPLEWCERKEGDTIDWSSDEITWDNKGKENWQHPTPFSGLQPKVGDLCDELGIIRARYRNPLWLAKHGRKGMVFNNNTNRWEPDTSALDELVKQAQELHMGYETDKPYVESHEQAKGETQPKVGNKYHRTIHGVSEGSLVVDVYNVLDAFGVTCPACQHAIKKLLCAGLRNKGSRLQDLTEAAESASRAVTLEKQREQ